MYLLRQQVVGFYWAYLSQFRLVYFNSSQFRSVAINFNVFNSSRYREISFSINFLVSYFQNWTLEIVISENEAAFSKLMVMQIRIFSLLWNMRFIHLLFFWHIEVSCKVTHYYVRDISKRNKFIRINAIEM